MDNLLSHPGWRVYLALLDNRTEILQSRINTSPSWDKFNEYVGRFEEVRLVRDPKNMVDEEEKKTDRRK
jgi:hypothetical protein